MVPIPSMRMIAGRYFSSWSKQLLQFNFQRTETVPKHLYADLLAENMARQEEIGRLKQELRESQTRELQLRKRVDGIYVVQILKDIMRMNGTNRKCILECPGLSFKEKKELLALLDYRNSECHADELKFPPLDPYNADKRRKQEAENLRRKQI